MGSYNLLKSYNGIECPKCENLAFEFQSKDGIGDLSEIGFDSVDNFYGECPICGQWNEYNRIKGTNRFKLDNEDLVKKYNLKKLGDGQHQYEFRTSSNTSLQPRKLR